MNEHHNNGNIIKIIHCLKVPNSDEKTCNSLYKNDIEKEKNTHIR